MSWRAFLGCVAGACMAIACGGSEFDSDGTPGTGGTGATAGAAGAASGTGGVAGAAGEGIVVVQATETAFDDTSDVPTLTLDAAPGAGNAIVVGITCFSEVDNCTVPENGVTDNHGNIYSRVTLGMSVESSTTHGVRPHLFIAENIASPGGPLVISADPNGLGPDSNQSVTWGAIEVAGLQSPPSVGQTGSTPVLSGNPETTVNTDGPTAQANQLAVAVLADRTSDDFASITPEAGWTQHHVSQHTLPHSMVTRVLEASGPVSHTWTHDVPTRGTTAVIATFEGAASN